MSASDFDLPPALEAALMGTCRARAVARREQDAIRALVSSPPEAWPVCCGAECQPCVEDHKEVAREVLVRWRAVTGADG